MVSAASHSLARNAIEAATDHAEGTALCQLFHQLAQPSPTATLAAPALEAAVFPAPIDAPSVGRTAPLVAAYSARAPPELA